jgi:hypothetical protein
MPLGGSLGTCGTAVCAVEPPSVICKAGPDLGITGGGTGGGGRGMSMSYGRAAGTAGAAPAGLEGVLLDSGSDCNI